MPVWRSTAISYRGNEGGRETMAARLGRVLFWLGILTTIVFGVIILAVLKDQPNLSVVELSFVASIIVAPAVFGWVLRYVLAEDTK